MARTGRPRKPTALKVIEGTARPDRVNDDEPVPAGDLGDPPKAMTAAGRRIWKEFSGVYWWLKDADRPTFERFCETFALYRFTLSHLMDEYGGCVQQAKSGYQRASAPMQLHGDLNKQLDGIAADLGQTPTSRTKIRTGKQPEESPWQKFRGG